MHTTSAVTHAHTQIVPTDDKIDASKSSETSKKVEGLHKRIREEKDESAHDTANIARYKNKKVSCQITVISQDEEHILGHGILTENRRELRENKYEGGIKIVIASNRILRHGIGKVSVSQHITYQAQFKDNEELKRL